MKLHVSTFCGVLPKMLRLLTVLDGSPPLSKKATSRLKSVNFHHEIMEIDIIYSNLIEKSPPLQQSWAEP
jgi:hypothetical protein